jgi:hypothetical protein
MKSGTVLQKGHWTCEELGYLGISFFSDLHSLFNYKYSGWYNLDPHPRNLYVHKTDSGGTLYFWNSFGVRNTVHPHNSNSTLHGAYIDGANAFVQWLADTSAVHCKALKQPFKMVRTAHYGALQLYTPRRYFSTMNTFVKEQVFNALPRRAISAALLREQNHRDWLTFAVMEQRVAYPSCTPAWAL